LFIKNLSSEFIYTYLSNDFSFFAFQAEGLKFDVKNDSIPYGKLSHVLPDAV